MKCGKNSSRLIPTYTYVARHNDSYERTTREMFKSENGSCLLLFDFGLFRIFQWISINAFQKNNNKISLMFCSNNRIYLD